MFYFYFKTIVGIFGVSVLLLIALFFLIIAGICVSFIFGSLTTLLTTFKRYYNRFDIILKFSFQSILGWLGFLFAEGMAFSTLYYLKISTMRIYFPDHYQLASILLDAISPFLLITPLIVAIVIGVVRLIGNR